MKEILIQLTSEISVKQKIAKFMLKFPHFTKEQPQV